MSKKENFNKAVLDMFGINTLHVVAEEPQQATPVAEEGLSTDVQAGQVASPAAAHAAPYSLVPSTFLAPSTTLEGKLKSKGDVELAGSFHGEIESDGNVTLRADATCNIVASSLNVTLCHLTGDCNISGRVDISESSEVSGNIVADELHCSGTITGDITVKGALALEQTAHIYGNISAGTIAMARGAVIKGTVTTEQG